MRHETTILAPLMSVKRCSTEIDNCPLCPCKFQKMSNEIYNVGVIGYGLSAEIFQIPLIEVTPSFRLHAIVQRTPKPNDDTSKDHPGVKVYRDAGQIFKDPEIDVVVISTAPDSHFAFTKTALENGKHVMVEKPLVPTSPNAHLQRSPATN